MELIISNNALKSCSTLLVFIGNVEMSLNKKNTPRICKESDPGLINWPKINISNSSCVYFVVVVLYDTKKLNFGNIDKDIF